MISTLFIVLFHSIFCKQYNSNLISNSGTDENPYLYSNINFQDKQMNIKDSEGLCGNDLSYSYVSSSRNLVISGFGDMFDYSMTDLAPWKNYDINTIKIEEDCKSIGSYAFYECHYLSSIYLPSTLLVIGDSAFKLCKELQSIFFENSIISIGTFAFEQTGLKSITLPNNITLLNSSLFQNCEN